MNGSTAATTDVNRARRYKPKDRLGKAKALGGIVSCLVSSVSLLSSETLA